MKQIFVLTVLLSVSHLTTADVSTLGAVTDRGYLKCGVQAGYEGFASTDQYGEWYGFDADFCRAVSAAVVGDPKMVMFISADRQARIDSLGSGSADLVARVQVGLSGLGGAGSKQVGVLLHDSYGVMVPMGSPLSVAADLAARTICTSTVRGANEAVNAWLTEAGVEATIVNAPDLAQPLRRYAAGDCDAIVALRSDLAGMRLALGGVAKHRLWQEEFGKAPAGPRVRGGDDQWAKVVQWVLFALIEAEELGIDQSNVAAMREGSESGRVRQLLGVDADTGSMLGLDPSWAFNVISAVGNYGEMYQRNLGPQTPLALPRTRSRLWNAGGMLFAPPVVAR